MSMNRKHRKLRKQEGQGTISLVLTLLVVGFSVAVLMSYFGAADVSDVQEVVAMAQRSPEARALVAETLKSNPNPSNGALRSLRSKVNDVLVTATAREVTGDASLSSQRASEEHARSEMEKLKNVPLWAWIVYAGLASVLVFLLIQYAKSR